MTSTDLKRTRLMKTLRLQTLLGLALPLVLTTTTAFAQMDERMNHIPPTYMSEGVAKHSAGVMEKASPTAVPTDKNAILNLDSRRIEDVSPVAAVAPTPAPIAPTAAAAPVTIQMLKNKLQVAQMNFNGERLQYRQATRENDIQRAHLSETAMNQSNIEINSIQKQIAAMTPKRTKSKHH